MTRICSELRDLEIAVDTFDPFLAAGNDCKLAVGVREEAICTEFSDDPAALAREVAAIHARIMERGNAALPEVREAESLVVVLPSEQPGSSEPGFLVPTTACQVGP